MIIKNIIIKVQVLITMKKEYQIMKKRHQINKNIDHIMKKGHQINKNIDQIMKKGHQINKNIDHINKNIDHIKSLKIIQKKNEYKGKKKKKKK